MLSGFCLCICRRSEISKLKSTGHKKLSICLILNLILDFVYLLLKETERNFSLKFSVSIFYYMSVSVFYIPHINFFIQVFKVVIAPDMVTSCSPSTHIQSRTEMIQTTKKLSGLMKWKKFLRAKVK